MGRRGGRGDFRTAPEPEHAFEQRPYIGDFFEPPLRDVPDGLALRFDSPLKGASMRRKKKKPDPSPNPDTP